MKVTPISPIYKGGFNTNQNNKNFFKKHLDKPIRKEYNKKCKQRTQKHFEEVLKNEV